MTMMMMMMMTMMTMMMTMTMTMMMTMMMIDGLYKLVCDYDAALATRWIVLGSLNGPTRW